MFERAEVRRTGRAVSIALAALAHGLLLVAALVLLRKQPEVEQKEPPVIRIPQPPQGKQPGPGRNGEPPRNTTHPPRTRPPPRPVDPAPPPVEEIEDESAPTPEPESAFAPEGRGEDPAGPVGPDTNTRGGDCIGQGCSTTAGPAKVDIIDVGQPGIVRPRPLCDPAIPTMPEQARIMGITGAVVMRYVVETDGSVDRIQLRNSDAPPVLVEAVRTWLERCRFRPGVARGQEARIQIEQPFVFKLR